MELHMAMEALLRRNDISWHEEREANVEWVDLQPNAGVDSVKGNGDRTASLWDQHSVSHSSVYWGSVQLND